MKKIDVACTLCAGANHGTFNQTYNYVMVLNENRNKECYEKGVHSGQIGGVLDLSYPDSKTRLGRVIDEGQISPTLDTGCEVGVLTIEKVNGIDKESTTRK